MKSSNIGFLDQKLIEMIHSKFLSVGSLRRYYENPENYGFFILY
jgi:hypothetical protein